MFALDEQSRMVEKMVRQWCETKLAPRIPALEAGVEPPFPLMRDMAKTFGLAAMAEAAVKKRIHKLREAEAAAKGAGCSLMVMDTRKGGEADRMCQSLGYESYGEVPGYARSGDGELHTTVFYYRKLG